MAFETVFITSTRNGSSPITGPFRQDLAPADVVGLALSSMVGVTSVRWELLGRPEYSAAGGAGPEPVLLATAPTAAFTVDSDAGAVHKDGTYLVQATINPGSPGQVRKRAALARLSGLTIPGVGGTRPLRKPGAFEALEDNSATARACGYETPENRWHELLLTIAGGGGVIETLAGAYAVGLSAADQTLALDDARGGGVIINGAGGGFTGASALRINTAAGGPVVVSRATAGIGIGNAAPAQALHVTAAAPAVRLERTGNVAIDIKNVTDDLQIINASASTILALFPKTGGMRADLGVGIGAAPPTAAALALGAGSTVPVSAASTGRLRYNEVLQQWETSSNAGAFVPFGAGTGIQEFAGISTGATQLAGFVPPTTGAVFTFVDAVKDMFYLDRTSTLTADGITVVTVAGPGGGRWIRMLFPSLYWAAQPTWVIDPINGHDENEGDVAGIGNALKTRSEYARRTDGMQLQSNVVITIASSLLSTDNTIPHRPQTSQPLTVAGFTIRYQGTKIPLFTGTVAVTNRNGSTAQVTQLVMASLPTSWTASGLVGMIVEGVDGSGNPVSAVVNKDLGARTAWVTPPLINVLAGTFAPGTFANGSSVTVYDAPTLSSTNVQTILYDYVEFNYLRASRWEFFGNYNNFSNCFGPVASYGGTSNFQNCNQDLVMVCGVAALSGGRGTMTAAYGCGIRILNPCTSLRMNLTGGTISTGGSGGGLVDVEFDASALSPVNFASPGASQVLFNNFVYGASVLTSLVTFTGGCRGSKAIFSKTPAVTGTTGLVFTDAGLTEPLATLSSRQVDDIFGNVVIGPAGPTWNDNRSAVMANLGSGGSVLTNAANIGDITSRAVEVDGISTGAVQLSTLAFPSTGAAYARVKSVRDFFYLDRTSTLTADGITIVTALGGTGRWIRLRYADISWMSQAAWFVDPLNASGTASDENTGVDGTHQLRTRSEFARRTSHLNVTLVMTVTIADDLQGTDTEMPTCRSNLFAFVKYVGVQKVLFTGTITGLVNRNGSTSTHTSMTIASLPVSWTASGLVGKCVQWTDGGGVNFIDARVVTDEGGKTAWLSAPVTRSSNLETPFTSGTTVTVYDVPSLGTNEYVEGTLHSEYVNLKVNGGRFWTHGGSNSFQNCTGDAIISSGGAFFWYNGLSGIGAGQTLLVLDGYLSISGGYNRLVTTGGAGVRVNVCSTFQAIQMESGSTVGFLVQNTPVPSPQITCDIEIFSASAVLDAIFFPGLPSARLNCMGYVYGTTAGPSAVKFQGPGNHVTFAHTPNISGANGNLVVFSHAGTTANLSDVATKSLTDIYANRIDGPSGPTWNDNRSQPMTNLGSAGGVSTSAANYGDVLAAVTAGVGGFTPGSVIFASGTGTLTQDNASFFWDDANNRLGVGTPTPAAAVDVSVVNAASFTSVQVRNTSAAVAAIGAHFFATNGTQALDVGVMGVNATALSGAPNLTAGIPFIENFNIGGQPLYVGSRNAITFQTGTTQAERLRILATGEVQVSSLNAGGMVKSAVTTGQLSIAVSGTDYLAPATALTTGSILFAGPGGLVAQDNANLFFDDTNNRVGIGTATPLVDLDIQRNGTTFTGVRVLNSGATANAGAQFFASNGTNGTSVGVTGTSYVAGAPNPNLGPATPFLLPGLIAANPLYIGGGSPGITMQTGSSAAERLRILGTGEIRMSSLAAGGVVVAAVGTGELTIGSAGTGFAPVVTLVAGAGMTGGGDTSGPTRTFDVIANADGSIVVNPDDVQVGVLATDLQHGARGGGTQHALATTGTAGFMSATDKTQVTNARFLVQTTTDAPPASFSLGALASGVLQHVVTGIISAPTSLAMVAGQVPFGAAANGLLTQDANLFWDNTNKRLGIGTQTPQSTMTLQMTSGAGLGVNYRTKNLTSSGVASYVAENDNTTISMQVGAFGSTATPNASLPNLGPSNGYIYANTLTQLYVGSNGAITFQTGIPPAPQAERIRILGTGEVRLSSLAGGGVTQATAGTGQLGVTPFFGGNIPFGSVTGLLTQDIDFVWDSTNNRLGIGTSTPSFDVDVTRGGSTFTTVAVSTSSTGTLAGAGFNMLNTGSNRGVLAITGTGYTPLSAQPNLGADTVFLSNSVAGTVYIGAFGDITFQTHATIQAERMRILVSGEVAVENKLIGGTTPAHGLNLQATTNATSGGINLLSAVGIGRSVAGVSFGPPMLAIAGNMSTASGAAATLDYVVLNSPTITVTGSTHIATATGFNLVSFEAPVYSTTALIGLGGNNPGAATVVVKGPPTITGGGSFLGIGPAGLWVQVPVANQLSAVFDGQVYVQSALTLTGSTIGGIYITGDPAAINLTAPVAQAILKSGGGTTAHLTIGTFAGSGDLVFQGGSIETFRALGSSSAGDFQLGSPMLAANGTVATVLGSLGPPGSHTTVQEWARVRGSSGALRWSPLF